ncbi:hypothetical protein [Desulfovibrio ferrophilus]|uniref:Uncharacterized protein n=1 Tax=Desulfovibrio ferrophilus TaxID=241368 RepID=A0A2Z6AWK9_9BACT|nr:hypothetical protein [Desulfovibrio ferrophilus]BBD07585.1 uncharacterized protein DFE_0859 [Desulfovibrio ferrophilus]
MTREGLESKELAQALSKAYSSLEYHTGYLVPGEKAWLEDSGTTPPENWVTASDRIQERIIDRAGYKVGLIYFPKLIKGAKEPSAMMMKAVVRKAESLSKRSDIVIGISPWGGNAERTLLEKHTPQIHLLLGAGPGPGLAGRFARNGQTFWVRSYKRGKAVHVIHISKLPTRSNDWKWIKNGNISMKLEVLNQDLSEDADLVALLGKFTLPPPK